MYPVVNDIPSVETTFVSQKTFVLLVNVLENGTKTVAIIDSISESWCIDNRQSQLNAAFLNLNGGRIQLHRLMLFLYGIRNHTLWIKITQKQTVDEGGFSES